MTRNAFLIEQNQPGLHLQCRARRAVSHVGKTAPENPLEAEPVRRIPASIHK